VTNEEMLYEKKHTENGDKTKPLNQTQRKNDVDGC
jgi:hypothetical protein